MAATVQRVRSGYVMQNIHNNNYHNLTQCICIQCSQTTPSVYIRKWRRQYRGWGLTTLRDCMHIEAALNMCSGVTKQVYTQLTKTKKERYQEWHNTEMTYWDYWREFVHDTMWLLCSTNNSKTCLTAFYNLINVYVH